MKQNSPAYSSCFVENDPQLKACYQNQWFITRNVRDIGSRRAWLDEMSLTFLDCPEFGFAYRDGTVYQLPDLDAVFGDDEDMRWLSLYIECDGSNLYPRRISHRVERLRILNLFLKLRYPKLRPLLEGSHYA